MHKATVRRGISGEGARVMHSMMSVLGAQRAVYYAVRPPLIVPQCVVGEELPLSCIGYVAMPEGAAAHAHNPLTQAYNYALAPGSGFVPLIEDINKQHGYGENNIHYGDYARNHSVCYRAVKNKDNQIVGIMAFSTVEPAKQKKLASFDGKDGLKPRVLTKRGMAFANVIWRHFHSYLENPRKPESHLSLERQIEILEDIKDGLDTCLKRKSEDADIKSDETWDHSLCVGRAFSSFAKSVSQRVFKKPLHENMEKILRLAGVEHDVGKVGLDWNMLYKEMMEERRKYADLDIFDVKWDKIISREEPQKLTAAERYLVQCHVLESMHVLALPGIDSRLVKLVSEHHQGANGTTGYGPHYGLSQRRTPFRRRPAVPGMESQMLMICDVYDALSQDRSYKKEPSSLLKALYILKYKACTEHSLNENLLALFIQDVLLPDYEHPGSEFLVRSAPVNPHEGDPVAICKKFLADLPNVDVATKKLRLQAEQFNLLGPTAREIGEGVEGQASANIILSGMRNPGHGAVPPF